MNLLLVFVLGDNMRKLPVFCVILFAVTGCELTRTNDTETAKPTPVPVIAEHPPIDEVWLALAHSIELSIKDSSPIRTTRFSQVVIALSRNGNLTQSDALKLDSAIPDLTKSDRAMTTDDAAKIRGIK